MRSFSSFKKRALRNKAVREAYNALAPEFAIAEAIIRKRLERGLTQSQLAKKIGTKQSAISRLESGNYNASIGFLAKIAKALNLRLAVSMK